MELFVHIDGGSRGNPGPAAAGVVVLDAHRRPLFEAGFFLEEESTNNVAEYQGLIHALDVLAAWPDANVTFLADSELLVRQIMGQYRVKNPRLAELFQVAQRGLLRRGQWQIRHVPREQNARADELANLALDARQDVIETDHRPGTGPPKRGAAANPKPKARDRAPARADAAGSERVILARCTTGASRACPAPCKTDETFAFGATAPAHVCLDAAAAMLHTVLALRDASLPPEDAPPPLTVRCIRPACGAAFEITVASP